MSERSRVAMLLAVSMLVYGNALLDGFTFDDSGYIFVRPVTDFSLKGLLEPHKASNVFRPITFASFALNWAIGGARPWGYHLFNILVHAAVTLLLYLLLRRLLESLPNGTQIAWAAAALFAVHPIHTEAVASIVGRSELLGAGFLLAAWLLHLDDRQVPALGCLVLALMSKESAVVFLPLALAGDHVRGKLKPLRCYGWIAGVTVLYLGLFWKIKGGRFGQIAVSYIDNPLASFPAGLRILNALRVAWKYLGLHIFPATLSCDYSYNTILLYANWRHLAPAAAGTLLVLALWVWSLLARRNEWFLGGAIYLCGFAATANLFVPTGTIMGERLAYLPSAGICLLAALIWVRLGGRRRIIAWMVLGIVVVSLAARTVVRNRDWRDNFTLFSTDLRAVPRSAKLHANLAGEYMRRGQLDAAEAEYQVALRIFPDFPTAVEDYGLVEARMGHDQEARRLLQSAVSITRRDDTDDYGFAAVNLAAWLVQHGEDEEALKILNEAIAEMPTSARAWSNRAVIHYKRGEQADARADAMAALRLDPVNSQARSLLSALGVPDAVVPEP